MKTTTVIKHSILGLLIALNICVNAQSPCDSLQQPLNYSTTSHTFCVPGTYLVNQPMFGWQRITAQYCDTTTCEYIVNGGAPTHTPSIIFTPAAAGITNFTLTAMSTDKRCLQTVTWSFTTIVCSSLATGIQEQELNTDWQAVYFDLLGNPIPIRYNELIIQQIGNTRKKIVIQK